MRSWISLKNYSKKHQQTPSLEEVQKEKARRSCEYFIDKFVHIFDRDVPGTVRKLEMWPKQRDVIRAFQKHRLIIILKARQLGLTWLALAYALWKMIFNPGYTVVGLSRGDTEAMELVDRMGFMLKYLPRWLIQPADEKDPGWTGLTYTATLHLITIYHPGGEAAKFQAFPASANAGRSFTSSLVIIDEWAFQQFAEEIWTAAYPTINRPTGGQVIGLSTGKRGTWFETVWNAAKAGLNSFFAIFLSWRTDPRRTDSWYEETKKNLPNTYRQEYPANESDAFTVGEGAFFPEWDEEIHVVDSWEPPNNARWRIVGAYDPGYASHACFKWYAISPDGWARCFREYYPHRVTDREQAKEILRRSVYHKDNEAPMRFEYIVADTDAWTPSRDTGKSTADVFAEYGLYMIQASKSLENGWRRLHEWLEPFEGPDGKKTALLTFTRDCANTIRTYPSCEQSKTNPEDISRDSEHHPQDVDRYFVMSRPEPARESKKPLKGQYTVDELEDMGLSRAEIREMIERGQVIGHE
jgi:hypothetical protein